MATNKQRPGMMLYFEDLDSLYRLTDAQLGCLIRLMSNYACTGEYVETGDERVDMMMSVYKCKMDRDQERYDAISKRRSNASRKSHAQEEEDLQQLQQMQQMQPTPTPSPTSTPTPTPTTTPIPSPVFVPPTREQATAYADEIGFASGVDRFMDYYSGVGWQMGAKPMRDWRAAMRMWKRKDTEKGVNTHAGYTEPDDAELFKGMSAEDIALLDELAAEHWG